jgi:hypothetical protein
MNESTKVLKGKGGQSPMDSMFLFLGVVLLYFALQLWILPKLGIPT